jgi:hypothetical protein
MPGILNTRIWPFSDPESLCMTLLYERTLPNTPTKTFLMTVSIRLLTFPAGGRQSQRLWWVSTAKANFNGYGCGDLIFVVCCITVVYCWEQSRSMQWILVDGIWWVGIYWGIESGNTALTPWVTWVEAPMIGQAFLFAVCHVSPYDW